MIRTVLTDIEGTTSAITFVQEVLFPYAAQHLPAFVRRHAGEPAVRQQVEAVRSESGAIDDEAAITVLLAWIREDRKATALKALQGMIWADGYRSGAYQAHLYPEVAAELHSWRAAGRTLAVYSSGSVQAQRLFFGHSEAGDLTPLFSAYFDTTVGGKRSASSYEAITATLGGAPSSILFLSDVVAELDAAKAAGLATHLLCRDGTPDSCPHPIAQDFTAVASHWRLSDAVAGPAKLTNSGSHP